MVGGKRTRHLIGYLFCLFLPLTAWGTQYRPWLGNFGEFEWRNAMRFQTYHHLLKGNQAKPYASDDLFLESSLAATIFNYQLEFEVVGANTRRQSGIDHLKLTGRNLILDDINGDPLSLAAGISLIQTFSPGLHDPSAFHHGYTEAEIFLSFGKEFYDESSYEVDWKSRVWALIGMGTSFDRGSPWQNVILAYEQSFKLNHRVKVFTNALYGDGSRRFHFQDFKGYGSVQHASVDVGIRYTYLIDFFGNASLEYTNRVYSYNFPSQVSQITLQVLYSFGL